MKVDFVFDDRDLFCSSQFFVSISIFEFLIERDSSVSFLQRILTFLTTLTKNVVHRHEHYLYDENTTTFSSRTSLVKKMNQQIVRDARNNKTEQSKLVHVNFSKRAHSDRAKNIETLKKKSLILLMSHQDIIYVTDDVSTSFNVKYAQDLNRLFDE